MAILESKSKFKKTGSFHTQSSYPFRPRTRTALLVSSPIASPHSGSESTVSCSLSGEKLFVYHRELSVALTADLLTTQSPFPGSSQMSPMASQPSSTASPTKLSSASGLDILTF